ncbi:TPA: hypothetical protein ACH3X1_016599 [Trebouxia sp. C0004]
MAKTLGPVALKLQAPSSQVGDQVLVKVRNNTTIEDLREQLDRACKGGRIQDVEGFDVTAHYSQDLPEGEYAIKQPAAGSPPELLYTPFWAKVGYGLPEVIGRQLGLNISESRDKEDASITIADKRRNYMQHLNNVLVVGGEDKPKRELMQKAVQELLAKHTGANAARVWRLGY